MKGFLLLAWLSIPLAAAAFHYGPGQLELSLDEVGVLLATAEAETERGQLSEDLGQASIALEARTAAVKAYDEALKLLPSERVAERQRVRLEKSKVQMVCSQLPQAHREVGNLLDELAADPATDPELLADARLTRANAQYYMTWLLRLEGRSRDEWEPEIEGARQNYRLLAEVSTDPAVAVERKKDLDSAIRLARLDLGQLEALPLPSQ